MGGWHHQHPLKLTKTKSEVEKRGKRGRQSCHWPGAVARSSLLVHMSNVALDRSPPTRHMFEYFAYDAFGCVPAWIAYLSNRDDVSNACRTSACIERDSTLPTRGDPWRGAPSLSVLQARSRPTTISIPSWVDQKKKKPTTQWMGGAAVVSRTALMSHSDES